VPVIGLEGGLAGGEEGPRLCADLERLVGQAEGLVGGGGILGTPLAVGLGGARHLGDAPPDLGAGDDQLGAPVVLRLGLREGGQEAIQIMAVHRARVPAEGGENGGGVLALGHLGHGVEGDVVGIVDQDQVVELVVAGEGGGLAGHALLQAAVAGEADDMVIEDGVAGGVEAGHGHPGGDGVADGVGHALAERAGGRLDARRPDVLGMARGERAGLAELLQFVQRQRVTGQMEPSVEEHRAVPGREDEAVAVDPLGCGRVEPQAFPEERGPDLGAAEGQAEVAGGTGVHGVDGETAGFVGGLGEDGFVHVGGRVGIQGSRMFAGTRM